MRTRTHVAPLECGKCHWTIDPDRTLPTIDDILRDQEERVNDHADFFHPEYTGRRL